MQADTIDLWLGWQVVECIWKKSECLFCWLCMLVEIGLIFNEFNTIYLFYSPYVTGENTLKYNYKHIYI